MLICGTENDTAFVVYWFLSVDIHDVANIIQQTVHPLRLYVRPGDADCDSVGVGNENTLTDAQRDQGTRSCPSL